MGARGTREGAGLAFLVRLAADQSGCIEYPFGKYLDTGYGRVRHAGRTRPAHVVSFEMHVGPVPEGCEICHNCGNRPCVNPAHLRADTHQGNMADCVAHGTHSRGDRNGRARLTTDQVQEIHRRARGGESQADLADEFGMSRAAINHISCGRTWRHLFEGGKTNDR